MTGFLIAAVKAAHEPIGVLQILSAGLLLLAAVLGSLALVFRRSSSSVLAEEEAAVGSAEGDSTR